MARGLVSGYLWRIGRFVRWTAGAAPYLSKTYILPRDTQEQLPRSSYTVCDNSGNK